MATQQSERPLAVVGADAGATGAPAETRIYVNREGAVVLRDLLDKLLAGGDRHRAAVFQDGNWSWLTVILSDQEDFSSGAKACDCGCQKPFAGMP